MGYLVAITFEYIIFGYAFFVAVCTWALAIGAFWLVISGTKDIQRMLKLIKINAKANKNQSNKQIDIFSEYIEFHGMVKKLSTIEVK